MMFPPHLFPLLFLIFQNVTQGEAKGVNTLNTENNTKEELVYFDFMLNIPQWIDAYLIL